jgi:hypothetical protein
MVQDKTAAATAVASIVQTTILTQLVTTLFLVVPSFAQTNPGVFTAGTDANLQREIVLAPVVFGPAPAGTTQTKTVSGTIRASTAPNPIPPTSPDWVYLPVEVPSGVNEIAVSYSYDKPMVPTGELGNAMDIGVFDERGIQLGDQSGFRGWSGGARTEFFITNTEATPGYIPGHISPGRWHVIFGPYTVASQGLNWTASVTLSYGPEGPPFVPNYAPDRAAGRGKTWYRGDLHLHTHYSDGKYLPQEVVSGSRAAGLDFMVSTEHNTWSADAIWGNYAQPDLLIISGEEITTRNGHYNAYGLPHGKWIDWRYRATDDDAFVHFVNDIHQSGALAVANHPYCSYIGCFWKFGYEYVDAIEVWNGPWGTWGESALADWDNQLVAVANSKITKWIPAVGASDAHRGGQVIALPQDAVLADDLETSAILDGIRNGHLWIAESSKVNLTFTASAGTSCAGIGDRLAVAPLTDVTVTLNVSGVEGCTKSLSKSVANALLRDAKDVPEYEDEPEPKLETTTTGCLVRFITDLGRVLETPLPETGEGTVTFTTSSTRTRYVRAEVRRLTTDPVIPATMVAFTNPIFLGK